MKIVIIDDYILVSKSFAGVLEAKGYETECFQTAHDFFSASAFETADCLLVDLHLPDMNGCEIIRRLRDDSCNVPAIVITGDIESDLFESITQYENVIKLIKPCPVLDIYEAIEKLTSV